MEQKDSLSSSGELRDLNLAETSRYSRSAGSIGLHGDTSASMRQGIGVPYFPKVKMKPPGSSSRFEDALTRPKTTGPSFAPKAGSGFKRSRGVHFSSSSRVGSRSRSRSKKKLQGIPPDVPTDSPSAWEADRQQEREPSGRAEAKGTESVEGRGEALHLQSLHAVSPRTYPLRLLSTSYDFEGAFQDFVEDGPRSDVKLQLVQSMAIGSPCTNMDFTMWDVTDKGLEELTEARRRQSSSARGTCKRVNFSPGVLASPGSLLSLLSSVPSLTWLDLRSSPSFTDPFAAALALHCPGIRRLDCSGSPCLGDAGFSALGEIRGPLEWLGMADCALVSDAGLVALAERSRGLEYLDISGNRCFSDASLRIVLQSCRALKELKMAACSAPMGHMFLLPSLPGTLAVNISSLVVLDLSKCIRITDSAVTWMLDSCSNLRRLSLANCVRVSDNGVAKLAAAQTQLRAIDISGCPNLTSASWILLLQNMREMQELTAKEMVGITARWWKSLSAMNEGQRKKRTRHLKQAQRMDRLSAGRTRGSRSTEQEVDTKNGGSTVLPAAVTSSFAITSLIKLDLSDSKHVSDLDVACFASLCPGVKELRLERCPQLSDTALVGIGQHCASLSVLRVSEVTMMSDRAVIAIAKGCRWLQTLKIRYSSQRTDEFHIPREFNEFTDKGAVEILSNCRFLRFLDFSYNTKLKSLGLAYMANGGEGSCCCYTICFVRRYFPHLL